MYSISSYRSYKYQKMLWNRKFDDYTERGTTPVEAVRIILEYTAIPGSSRHHWGADLDVIDYSKPLPEKVLYPKNYRPGGVFENLGLWLAANARSFGFYQAYPNDPARPGFKHEPWHYSFAELSIPLLKRFMEIDVEKHLVDETILGSEIFSKEFLARYKKEYCLGINPELIPEGLRGKTDV